MFLLATLGVGLAAMGVLWEITSRRQKEMELLFVGDQYRRAIQSYYQATLGTRKQYPKSLTDLLEDHRFPAMVRHLRRLYVDPMTASHEWGLVLKDGGIAGVHSQGQGEPFKKSGFSKRDASF